MHPATVAPPEQRRPARPSWVATEPRGRRLLGVTAVLVAVSILVIVQAARLNRTQELRRITGPLVVSVDAAGCPVGVACGSSSNPPPALLAAVLRHLPASRIDSVSTISDSATGRPYRVSLIASEPGGASLSLIAQRLPGSPVNDPPYLNSSDRSHSDLAGNVVVDAHLLRAVVPGQPGCSVGLTLTYHSAEQTSLDRAVTELARDPAMQLSP
jgi:hypothetical protein